MRLDIELGLAADVAEVGDKVTMKFDVSNPEVVEYYVNGKLEENAMPKEEVRALILRMDADYKAGRKTKIDVFAPKQET